MEKITEFKMGDVEDPHLYAQLHIHDLKLKGEIPDSDDISIFYKLKGDTFFWAVDVFKEEKLKPILSTTVL